MSSAILYLAIIAIWACVLIPRWLKRGAATPVTPADSDAAGPAGSADADELPGTVTEAPETAGHRPAAPQPQSLAAAPALADPVPADDSRRRILAARRRLLLILAALEAAAVTLAVTGLAAVWVVIPPTVMLGGYLLLLREAAKADAERARDEAEAAANARERAAARAARARAAGPVSPAQDTPVPDVAAAAAALAAKLAAAPVPADYEDSGRDFAPGLAGKYTTSNAHADPAEDDYYGGYEPPRLRAVGD